MSIHTYYKYSWMLVVATAGFLGALVSCTDEDIPGNDAPTLSVQEASNVLRTSVILSGSITGATDLVKDYGFQYSESENFPTDRTSDVSMKQEGATSLNNLTTQVRGLTPNETYYYRMYATTGATVVYSNNIQFRTANMSAPQIANVVTDSIGERVALISFDIEDYGNEVLIEVGLGYKKSDEKTYIPVAADELSSDDHYTIQITGLDADTQYDFRPYAKNGADAEASTGTIEGYGEVLSQKTAALLSADVQTVEIVDGNIGMSSVKVAGKVLSAKGSNGEITGCGFVWSSTVKSPTLEFCDGGVSVNPEYDLLPFNFSADVTGLEQSTTYYLCAYATNIVDGQERIAYGEVREFSTNGLATPQLEFSSKTDENGYSNYDIETTATTIQVKANIKNYDNYACAERGVIWSKSSADITVDKAGDNQLKVLSDSRQFTALIENLELGTSYYVRAYAIYKVGEQQTIGYSNALECSTSSFTKPTLGEVAVNSEKITRNSAELTGRISDSGNGTITERGFVISPTNKTNSPSLDNCEISIVSDESFTTTVTGLQASTEYAVRSYVKSKLADLEEISYAWSTVYFRTSDIVWPEFNNMQCKDEDRTLNSIKVSCGIASVGDGTLEEKGFCWIKVTGVEDSPTLEQCTGSQKVNDGTNQEFSYTISALEPNTTYRIRTYAKMKIDDEVITYYSSEIFVSTMDYNSPSLYVGVNDVSFNSAKLEGRIEGGNLTVTEKGFVMSADIYEVTISNADKVLTVSDVFEASLTDLVYNSFYNVRSYVKCQKGENSVTIYSGTNQFRTQDIDFISFDAFDYSSSISSIECKVNVNAESRDGVVYKKRGLCGCLYKDGYTPPTINDLKVEEDYDSQSTTYQLKLTGLQYASEYIIRPYVILSIDGDEVVYYSGSHNWCRTSDYNLNINVSNIKETSCDATVEFAETYDLTDVEYGVMWTTNRDEERSTWSKQKCTNLNDKVYSCTITGLSGATTYYVAAYFVIQGKTYYHGGVWEFNTKRKPSQDDNDSPNLN